ncbi:MAG: PEP-utilizing enzyme [Mycobacteriales bacterium]
MTSDHTTTALRFDPPGPGAWRLDPVHMPRPATKYWAEMHPEAFKRGFRDMTAFYGLLLDYNELAYPNGFMYGAARPVPEEQIPERFARAEEVFDKKLWREQLRVWDETAKPASIRAHRELQSIDPEKLSDVDLAAHLRKCRDHHADMISQHMRFTGAATIPVGDLMAHVVGWTGLPPAHLLGMMRGAAPVSGGGSAEHDRMIDAMRQDATARALLDSDGDPAKVLDSVRDLDSDAGRAMSDYLDLAGYRLLDGFDISGRYALEAPDALLRAIRSSVAGRGAGSDGSDVQDLIADVRRQVPDEHRAQFDELVDEARTTYRIRDERGVYSDIWASGLMRRAAMAAGRRLGSRGRIHDPEHFVHAGFDEMQALITGADGPSADELAARYEYQTTHTAKDAPPFLGDAPTPPPDPAGLPPAPARLMRAMGFAMNAMFEDSVEEHEESVIKGMAASGGVYEGPVCRVSSRADFNRIKQGDVLVTESTTEAFNILLPLLGALVTDSGGLLSHAAIVSREYAIPGVVGTRDATQRITDGTIVRVDGDAGEVTIRG